jgi:hypothetical protein
MHIKLSHLPYKKLLCFLVCTLVGAAVFGTIIHEGGHCLSAVALGGRVKMIIVFPGIELYPKIKLDRWDFGVLAGCDTDGVNSKTGKGFVTFMGSGSNLIAAYLVLVTAIFIKPKWLCIMLILQAMVYGWDIITYSILPLFGIPHHVIMGGRRSEPLLGALSMGCPKFVYFVSLFVHSVLLHSVIVGIVLKRGLHKTILSNMGLHLDAAARHE